MIFISLAWSFAKIGLLSFGGGYAMLPLIQREVEKFGIHGREFVDILAVSQITPGPIGVNAATYTGYKVAGIPGSLAATFFCVLPTFILMALAAHFFYRLKGNPRVDGFFKAIRPVFIGLIAGSVVLMARDIRLWADFRGIAIFIAAFICSYRFKLDPVLVILCAGAVGFLLY